MKVNYYVNNGKHFYYIDAEKFKKDILEASNGIGISLISRALGKSPTWLGQRLKTGAMQRRHINKICKMYSLDPNCYFVSHEVEREWDWEVVVPIRYLRGSKEAHNVYGFLGMVHDIEPGDSRIELQPEPENPNDQNAIKVLSRGDFWGNLGYIGREYCEFVGRVMRESAEYEVKDLSLDRKCGTSAKICFNNKPKKTPDEFHFDPADFLHCFYKDLGEALAESGNSAPDVLDAIEFSVRKYNPKRSRRIKR